MAEPFQLFGEENSDFVGGANAGTFSDPGPSFVSNSRLASTVSQRIYVEIPDEIANLKMKSGTGGVLESASTGATIGAVAGTIIPGVGNVVGGVIGGAIGGVGDFLGLWGGSDDIRVSELMRDILRTGFSKALPGEVGHYNNGPTPILLGQFDRATINAAMQSLRTSVMQSVEPGSDAAHDLGAAFSSYLFHERDQIGETVILVYEESIPQTSSNNALSSSNFGLGIIVSGIIAAFSG